MSVRRWWRIWRYPGMAWSSVAAVLISSLLSGSPNLSAQNSGSIRADNFSSLYLINPEMGFLRIDQPTLSLKALWSLPLTPKLSDVLPLCNARSGCIAAKNFRYDGRDQLFGVFPKNPEGESVLVRDTSNPAGGSAKREVPVPAGSYQVLGLRLPDFDLTGRMEIPQPQTEAPSILLTPDGRHLYIEYRDTKAQQAATAPTIAVVLDVYDAQTFKKESSIQQSALAAKYMSGDDLLDALFSNSAYFSSDGKYIFDGLNRIEISGGHAKKEWVNPLSSLTDVQRKVLAPYVKTVAAKPYYDFNIAESARGRTVVWMTDEKHTKLALWTTDLTTGADSPVIISPFGSIRLADDGSRIVVEESASRAKEGGAEADKSGRVTTFDAASGKQTGDFSSETLRGSAGERKSLCVSPEGALLVEATKENILLVDLNGQKVKAIPAAFPANPGTACIFVKQ